MHKVQLAYTLAPERAAERALHHPLLAMLAAVHAAGSISGAARRLELSYRHVWGELKRWEGELGQPLVLWAKGQPALLAPFGEKLLWSERRALARLAPQIEALRSELERAFALAFDDSAGVVTLFASFDEALPRLRDRVGPQLHLDIEFTGSVAALAALNDGRCLLAGFHALTASKLRSPTATTYRSSLKPGRHKLIGFARRAQGLIVAAGNPLQVGSLHDLVGPALRFANGPRGSGTRVVLEELLAAARIAPAAIAGFERGERSHQAAAEAVASGSADAAFGTLPAAQAKGLHFVPLAEERYFLVTLAAHLKHPHVLSLLAALQSEGWRSALDAIPGHAAERCGEVLALSRVLPWWNYRKAKHGKDPR
ncbi:MAG: substrate-binding domain-containing protein [Pseudomonadota bacterium]